jgi:two-component system, sensor histidine kinase
MEACRDRVSRRPLGRAPSGLRILIVEDNKDSRETLRTLLELLGHHVDVAEDGVEGIHKALSCSPTIALVDVGLPILDGYKVAQCIRTVLGRGIFLVAHTGYGQPEDRRRAFEAGFDAHLVKPVDWLELNSWLSDLSNPTR